MIRTCTRILRFAIAVSRVDLTPKELRKDAKLDFHPVTGRRQQRLGACVLNQPANQNLLSEQMLDQLYRFLASYDFDHSVQNVWLQSKEGVFCHGLDYKRLAEHPHYLDKLSRLAVLVASANKPVFAQVEGGAKGAGAHLLSMLAMPLAYRGSCFMKLDDAARGMTPLLGGSHRLARLPMKMGLYLALTGDELNFEEMTQLGYIRGAISPGASGSDIRERLEEANLYFRQKPRYSDHNECLLQQEERVRVRENQEMFAEQMKFRQGEILSQASRNLNLKFAVNQHLAARSDYFNATNPYNSFSLAANDTVNNYYLQRLQRPLDYLAKHALVQPFSIDGLQLPRLDLARIDYIFSMDSLQEVLSALQQENAEWAQRAYNRILASDPLAAHLTFRMIKEAEGKPWISCLEREFTVARRLVEQSTLRLKTYKNSSHYVLENKWTGKDINSVPAEAIDAILAEGEGDYKLQHSVPAYSLHPYCDYYQLLPDSVRKYLNRQQLNDSILSEQQPEVMRYLNKNKINYSSQVYSVDLLRKAQFQRLQLEHQRKAQTTRLSLLASNDHFLSTFTAQRQAYLHALPDAELQSLIDQQLSAAFRNKFQQRFAEFQDKTAGVMGLQKKVALFKGIKETILNNLLHNGAAYEEYQRRNTSFNGPLYFDAQGRDIYSSQNPHISADPAFKQLGRDLSQGLTLSPQFQQHANQQMPLYTATPPVPLRSDEQYSQKMWELIRFRYDQKPEVWAEAYVYKEMVEQAARTSQELAGYLEWTSQNFYDLLNQSDKKKETYGQFATGVVGELRDARRDRIKALLQVQRQRKALGERGVYSKVYQVKEQQKLRQCFPYLVNEGTVPGEFRKAFLGVVDSVLKQFTEMKQNQQKLQFKQELGPLDLWINRDIANTYTAELKNDVQYVSSYLQMLMVKDLLVMLRQLENQAEEEEQAIEGLEQALKDQVQAQEESIEVATIEELEEEDEEEEEELKEEEVKEEVKVKVKEEVKVKVKEEVKVEPTLEHSLDIIREHFNVDFTFGGNKVTIQDVHGKIFAFLHFLMDMHSAAKRKIRSPQSKLIDFINRLKQTQEQNPLSGMPYTFESLLLMIAKDRRRIYDRYLGQQFVSEPELYLEHITREASKRGDFLLKRKTEEDAITMATFGGFVDRYSDLYRAPRTALIQNYFYYMMLFEKYVHQVCGQEAFLPADFVPKNAQTLNAYCAKLFRPRSLPQWLSEELEAVVEQLLGERLQAQRRLSRGELLLFDQRQQAKFSAANMRQLLGGKLEEEVYLLKNMFVDSRNYDSQLSEEEEGDEEYARAKRAIVNREALKKLNNLSLTEEAYVEYMEKTAGKEGELPAAQSKFSKNQRHYYKHGMVTRLPSKSYHRMARDLFAYPEEVYPQYTPEQIALFKKTHITFDKSVAEKILLSNFTEEYKHLNAEKKDEVLQQMVAKIAAVESL